MTAPNHAEPVSVPAVFAEGLNNHRKLTTGRAYGFRSFDAAKAALDHNFGA
jgi:hypothetical protein